MSAMQLPTMHMATLVDAAILHRIETFYHAGTLYRINHDTRTELIKMLTRENDLSIGARYASAEMRDPRIPRHPSKALNLSPGGIVKAVNSYQYQSCEHDGWANSQARTFCQALVAAMARKLPGYDDADTWVIS